MRENALEFFLTRLPLALFHVNQAHERPGIGVVLLDGEHLRKEVSAVGKVPGLHGNRAEAQIA